MFQVEKLHFVNFQRFPLKMSSILYIKNEKRMKKNEKRSRETMNIYERRAKLNYTLFDTLSSLDDETDISINFLFNSSTVF